MSLARDGRFVFARADGEVCECGLACVVAAAAQTPMSRSGPGAVVRVHAHPHVTDTHVVLRRMDDGGSRLSVVGTGGVHHLACVNKPEHLRDFVVRERASALVLSDRSVYEVPLRPATRPAGVASTTLVPTELGPALLTVPANVMARPWALAWDGRRHILWIMSSRGEVATWAPGRPAPNPVQLVQRLFSGTPTQIAVDPGSGSLVVLLSAAPTDFFLVVSRAGDVAQLCRHHQEPHADEAIHGFAVVQQPQQVAAWRAHASYEDVSSGEGDVWVLLCVGSASASEAAVVQPRGYGAPVFLAPVRGRTHDIWTRVQQKLQAVSSSRVLLKCRDSDVVVGHRETLAARIGYFGQLFQARGAHARTHARGAPALEGPSAQQAMEVCAPRLLTGAKRKGAWTDVPDDADVEGDEEEGQEGEDVDEEEGDDAVAEQHVDVNAHDSVVTCVVHWANTGQLLLTAGNVEGVAGLAASWQLWDVVRECEEWLIDHLSVGNGVEVLQKSERLQMKRLRSVTLSRLAGEWETMAYEGRRGLVEALEGAGPLLVNLMMRLSASQ